MLVDLIAARTDGHVSRMLVDLIRPFEQRPVRMVTEFIPARDADACLSLNPWWELRNA
jgi:hypothetical protein